MNNSDIIAIIAIGTTLLTTIISAVVVITTTRSAIQAKKSEIAFSERLKAFQIVYELISDVNSKLSLFQHVFASLDYREYLDYNKILNNKSETVIRKVCAETMRRLDTIASEFMPAYNKQRVYIPQHIDQEILKYYKEVLETASTQAIGDVAKNVEYMKYAQDRYSEKILSEIHKFIGFN